MRYSELFQLLQELGTEPKKGLSQNFLIDSNVVLKILQTADVQPAETILEIGPGPGALTTKILESKAHVIAIEKDPIFAQSLQRLQTADQRLKVICADALEVDFSTLKFDKVVANLPYHITTPLLEKCFETEFQSLTLMVQKEVADRIFAKSGTKDFGSLSLFANFYTDLKTQFVVPPQCFYPKPGVDSSVIHLTKKKFIHRDIEAYFFLIMRRSFQQRRKMLSSSLQTFTSSENIKNALLKSGIRPDARPEMLNFDAWIIFLKNLIPCIVQNYADSCPHSLTSLQN